MRKKLPITKRQAIKECKQLWAKVEELDSNKFNVIREYYPHMLRYVSQCPLCHYSYHKEWKGLSMCSTCPLQVKHSIKGFAGCVDLGYHGGTGTSQWYKAIREL